MADLSHLLGCILFNNLLDLIVALGTLRNKLVVLQALFNDHMHHTVGESHVGTGLQLQVNVCLFRQTSRA